MSETKEIAIQKKVAPIIKKADALTILSGEDMKDAVATLSTLNKWNDDVEEDEDKIVKPMKEALKEVQGRYKPLKAMLADAIANVRSKMTIYQTEVKRIADEKAAKIAARVGEGKGKLGLETASNKIDAIEKPDQKVASDEGMVRFETVKKFEVMDITMLPIQYHLADEVAIRAQMKAGIELKGVRYYTEERPINTR